MTERRNFTKDEIENGNVAIIPENLVDEEGKILKVDDYITIEYRRCESDIYREIIDNTDFESPTLVLKIVGKFKVIDEKHDIEPYPYSYKIYAPNHIVENYSNMIMSSYENALNIDNLMNLKSEYYFPVFLPNTILSPYFVLNSFEEADEFKERTEALLNKQTNIKDYYQVVTNNDTVIRILKPLESIDKISNILSNGLSDNDTIQK